MDVLQELGILDSLKNGCYLFLGVLVGYLFWERCESSYKKEILKVNPLIYIFTLCWGASGFFFLPKVFSNMDQIIQRAFPDWDIPLSLFLHLNLLQHRSWLFSSTLVPIALLSIVLSFQFLRNQNLVRNNKRWLTFIWNFIRDFSIGLSVGVSAHLIGDFSFQWIPAGDTNISIFGWQELYSHLWLILNIFLGLIIPFLVINRIRLPSNNDEAIKNHSSKKKIMECPSCSAKLRLPTGRTGKVNCPKCSHSFNTSTI